jgi:curved DNA-binding protein CbpA
MAEINEAWAVLGDPAERAHYDSTGSRRNTRQADDAATELASRALMTALDKASLDMDIVGSAIDSLQRDRNRAFGQIDQIDRVTAKLERALQKLRRKDSQPLGRIGIIIVTALDNARQARVAQDDQLAVLNAAIALLQEYEWEGALPPPKVAQRTYSSTLGGFITV